MLFYWQKEKSGPQWIRKEKDMTAMIRLFNLNSEHSYAQLDKKELGYDCARPFKDGVERMNCVNEPGWK